MIVLWEVRKADVQARSKKIAGGVFVEAKTVALGGIKDVPC